MWSRGVEDDNDEEQHQQGDNAGKGKDAAGGKDKARKDDTVKTTIGVLLFWPVIDRIFASFSSKKESPARA